MRNGGLWTKTDINPASVFRVFDLLSIHLKPYENEFSTALSECKAVARCATRKTDTAINRIKTVGLTNYGQQLENRCSDEQNKNRWGAKPYIGKHTVMDIENPCGS